MTRAILAIALLASVSLHAQATQQDTTKKAAPKPKVLTPATPAKTTRPAAAKADTPAPAKVIAPAATKAMAPAQGTTKPAPATTKPVPAMTKAAPAPAGATPQTAKPAAAKPNTPAPAPAKTNAPATQAAKPAAQTTKPAAQTAKPTIPVTQAAKPATQTAKPPAPAPANASQAAKAPDAGKSTQVAERGTKGEVSFMREEYDYSRKGRRDPFVSLLATGDLRPLLSDLRLVAVAYDPTGRSSVAVMRDVGTKDQYRVKVGQTLGRMQVSQIQPKAVVFTVEEFGFRRTEVLAMGDSTARGK